MVPPLGPRDTNSFRRTGFLLEKCCETVDTRLHLFLWECLVDSIPSNFGMRCHSHHNHPHSRSLLQVIRYDDGPLVALQEVAELQQYVQQNSSADISRRREIRMALRSLDGHSVYWPYRHIEVRRMYSVIHPLSC